MRTWVAMCAGAAVVVAAATVGGAWYARSSGLAALGAPGDAEARVARWVRGWAVPPAVRARRNPLARSQDVLEAGRSHFADHCAGCHGNDGSGNVRMGRSLFPPSPDMRRPPTQDLTDGELFWIIEHGVRFTGMPGWSTGTPEGERASWELVHFIRRLPHLTPDEIRAMEELNPRSPVEIRQDIEAERFLLGQ